MRQEAAVLKIRRDKRYQKMLSFGVSGCWFAPNWSKRFGWDSVKEAVRILFDKQNGLGLNAYRYNVGGGRCDSPSEMHKVPLPENPSGSGRIDLSGDADQIAVLDEIMKLGLDELILFWNSPPYYMTCSGFTNGHEERGKCNLRQSCYDAFVNYVLDVADVFRGHGYPVRYLSPFNEPDNDQWQHCSAAIQEGCCYSVEQLLDLSHRLADKITARGTDYRLSLAEAASWKNWGYTADFYERLVSDPLILSCIDHVNGHSYWTGTEDRIKLKASFDRLTAEQKRQNLYLYQTEWALFDVPLSPGGMDSALNMARVLHEDFTILDCPRWDYWSAVSSGYNADLNSLLGIGEQGGVTVSKRAYVFGQYARFLVGTTRIGLELSTDEIYGSAYECDDGRVYLVLTNPTEKQVDFRFEPEVEICEIFETSETRALEKIPELQPRLAPHSVRTILIPFC